MNQPFVLKLSFGIGASMLHKKCKIDAPLVPSLFIFPLKKFREELFIDVVAKRLVFSNARQRHCVLSNFFYVHENIIKLQCGYAP
ncbi:MAG TPA: hypothetical protein DEQ27_01975 [Prevotella sp.]|nr:hypothetical protein [Prevotella sp.]